MIHDICTYAYKTYFSMRIQNSHSDNLTILIVRDLISRLGSESMSEGKDLEKGSGADIVEKGLRCKNGTL